MPPRWARSDNGWKWHKNMIIACFALGLIIFGVLYHDSFHWARKGFQPNHELDAIGRNAAVSSDVPECSQMGLKILKDGGTAADAAVTVALCIGAYNPQSSGLGGGGFMTITTPDGKSLVIDSREAAPAASHKNMFKDPLLSKIGGLASGVPGELAGLSKMHDLFGRVDWEDLIYPVADACDSGLGVNESLNSTYRQYFKQYGGEYRSGWDWLEEGIERRILLRPNLAKTLRLIAQNGSSDIFYDPEGPIAPRLARTVQQAGGIMTTEDIAKYEPILREPIRVNFLGRTMYVPPAPTSGPALVLGLNVIQHLLDDGYTDDFGAIETQRMIETMKWMAAARSELGDPSYIDNPRIQEIVTSEWADLVVANISDDSTLESWRNYHPSYEMNEPHGTAHLSVVDADGMAVAMTTTVNLPFGSIVCDESTGIVLNSEMDDFSTPDLENFFELAPSIYNFAEPGKRPLSSCVPSIAVGKDHTADIIIGAAGGSRILTTVFQALVRHLGYDMSLLDSISLPRIHHQLLPEVAMLEVGVPELVAEKLHERGHKTEYRPPSSVCNGISRDSRGLLHAVSDYFRKGGLGAAY